MINVEDHLKLVQHIIHKKFSATFNWNKYNIDRQDMVQECNIALIRAAKRFDESKGMKFSTFAASYIESAIKDYFRDKTKPVKFPRDALLISNKLKGRENIKVNEIVEEFGCTYNIAIVAADILEMKYVSFNKESGEREDAELSNIIPDDKINLEDEILKSIELKNKLDLLDDKEREIILLSLSGRYTQTEIGKKYGVSQAQISRIVKSSVIKMGGNIEALKSPKYTIKINGKSVSKLEAVEYYLSIGLSEEEIQNKLNTSKRYIRKLIWKLNNKDKKENKINNKDNTPIAM